MGSIYSLPDEDIGPRLTALPLSPASHWGHPSHCRWRWAINVDSWETPGLSENPEFKLLLGLVPEESENIRIRKLPFKDRKRSLVGHLMMRRACAQALGHEDFLNHTLSRTHGQKPFLEKPLPPNLLNFNFNISHDGRWVVLASDALRLIGTDISASQRERGEQETDDYLDDLQNLLSSEEMWAIRQKETVRERYSIFQRIWSAKESVTKAVGQGVDFGLERITVLLDGNDPGAFGDLMPWIAVEEPPKEVQHPYAEVNIDMWERRDWNLEQHKLPSECWATVALGPVTECIDRDGNFSATLRCKSRDLDARRLEAELPTPVMEVLQITDILPPQACAQLAEIRKNNGKSGINGNNGSHVLSHIG
jgi:4'-phosphopantetheinyl transferase